MQNFLEFVLRDERVRECLDMFTIAVTFRLLLDGWFFDHCLACFMQPASFFAGQISLLFPERLRLHRNQLRDFPHLGGLRQGSNLSWLHDWLREQGNFVRAGFRVVHPLLIGFR